MKTILKIVSLIFLVMGFGLYLSKFEPARVPFHSSNAKGAYADVASSGAFANAGLVLMAIGGLCWCVQAFIRQ